MTKKNVYIEKMKHQLDELNANMGKLEASATEAKEDVRAKYKEELRKLRHQSKLATEKFESLVAASEDSWENMMDEMEKMRDAFVHSFHYFKSQV
jgi:ribosome recycling factor